MSLVLSVWRAQGSRTAVAKGRRPPVKSALCPSRNLEKEQLQDLNPPLPSDEKMVKMILLLPPSSEHMQPRCSHPTPVGGTSTHCWSRVCGFLPVLDMWIAEPVLWQGISCMFGGMITDVQCSVLHLALFKTSLNFLSSFWRCSSSKIAIGVWILLLILILANFRSWPQVLRLPPQYMLMTRKRAELISHSTGPLTFRSPTMVSTDGQQMYFVLPVKTSEIRRNSLPSCFGVKKFTSVNLKFCRKSTRSQRRNQMSKIIFWRWSSGTNFQPLAHTGSASISTCQPKEYRPFFFSSSGGWCRSWNWSVTNSWSVGGMQWNVILFSCSVWIPSDSCWRSFHAVGEGCLLPWHCRLSRQKW